MGITPKNLNAPSSATNGFGMFAYAAAQDSSYKALFGNINNAINPVPLASVTQQLPQNNITATNAGIQTPTPAVAASTQTAAGVAKKSAVGGGSPSPGPGAQGLVTQATTEQSTLLG